MSVKTLFVNQISYKTSTDQSVLDTRESWITRGLKSLSLIDEHLKNVDMILTDNTVGHCNELPHSIVDSIPKQCEIVTDSSLNQHGRINPGAGNLEVSKSLKHRLTDYDFYVHHEPRTVIRHSNMFDSFFREPRNLFRNGSCHDASDDSQVWTGTYFISTKDFIRFLEWSDLKMMCDQSISIEYYMRTFLDSEDISFDTVQDAGILWNIKAQGINIEV